MSRWTIGTLLKVSAEYLQEKGSTSALLDAELLLAETLGQERVELYTEHDRPLSPHEVDAFRQLVSRRAKGEPVAYILGRAHFRYLALEVTPDVLIPRPETEELVDSVLEWLRVRPVLDPTGGLWGRPLIADVGTGSGAIALALAQETGLRVLAIDSSHEALLVAARNRSALELNDVVELRQGDLLSGVEPASLRVVVSNPPYVTDEEFAGLAPDVRLYEPRRALTAGPDGLEVYRRLIPAAFEALAPGGALFLEIGETQADAVLQLARGAGFAQVEVTRDLAGKQRIVRAAKAGAVTLSLEDLTPAALSGLQAGLRAGALLGVPTDTVYGLAAAWNSAPGIRRLSQAKGRDEGKPLQVLFASVAQVIASLPDLEPSAVRVLECLLPGPYTFVVSTMIERPPLVGTPDSLGVRVPAHLPLLGLLAALDTPLAASSANFSGEPAPSSVEEVDPSLLSGVAAAFVFAGTDRSNHTSEGLASTVVDLRPLASGADPVVLREGAVPADDLLRLISTCL